TSRSGAKRRAALEIGAHAALETGARLPEKADIVVETVGEATWSHSLKALKAGGTLVVAGATSGANPPADLHRVFYLQQRVIGSTGGTREEFVRLLRFLENTGVRPRIDRVLPLTAIHDGFRAMIAGGLNGKVVVRP
ncbi:zinc-binding dehydrogenase, partial [Streptomyces sp. UH6]|uniref:zinc-binding dehydrogenase n=1 Tax=Streptomyces sp. UH6 TaxID=2748379 RepID=UPI0015D4AFE1